MISDRDKGRGRDYGGEDVNLLEVDMDLMEADRVPLRKAPNNVGIVDVAIKSPKSAGRNLDGLSGHNYLILVLLPRVVFLRAFHRLFLADSSTVVLLQEKYDRIRHLEFSQNDLSATHASASAMHAYIGSPQKP